MGSLLELGAGFHPDFSGRENVYLNGSIQGLRRAEIRERFDEIVSFAELEHAIDRPVRTYSSGMAMRLGFAIAAFLQADVLLLDEVFAVGDENFQRKCFGVIAAFKSRGGTILFVSHDAQAVERLCERSILLAAGEKAFDGPTHEAIARYRRLLAERSIPPSARAERGSGARARRRSRPRGRWQGVAGNARSSSPGSPSGSRSTCAHTHSCRRRDSTSRCATPPASSSPRRRSGRRGSAGPTAPAASR